MLRQFSDLKSNYKCTVLRMCSLQWSTFSLAAILFFMFSVLLIFVLCIFVWNLFYFCCLSEQTISQTQGKGCLLEFTVGEKKKWFFHDWNSVNIQHMIKWLKKYKNLPTRRLDLIYIYNKTFGKTSWQPQKHSGWNLPAPLQHSITLAHACEKYQTEHGVH